MSLYERELAVAGDIARKVGNIMRSYFETDLAIERKGDGTPLTAADSEINRFVIKELGKNFDDGIIGEEESTAEYGMGRKWLCDPIDGTKGFTWGVPTAMFSLALVIDGAPVVGIAYDPFLDRMYEAVKGGGSFCNKKRLAVSTNELRGEYVGVSSRIEKVLQNEKHAAHMNNLLNAGARLACFSGSVYKSCLVARGKLVGYLDTDVNAYDMAAVHVIVEEAGGMLTGIDGKRLDYSKPFKGAIVSNKTVHVELMGCFS